MEKHSKVINTAYKVISIYEFDLAGLSPPLENFKIKVLLLSDNQYTCRVSHSVQRMGLMGFHRVALSMHDSEEEALSEVFSHGLMNYDVDVDDEGAKWERCNLF